MNKQAYRLQVIFEVDAAINPEQVTQVATTLGVLTLEMLAEELNGEKIKVTEEESRARIIVEQKES